MNILKSMAGLFLFWAINATEVMAASPNRLFETANVGSGKILHSEKRCASCHLQAASMNESHFYTRPERKVSSREKLIAQVETCNTKLNLGMFPEESLDIAAWLNLAYYKLN